MGFIHLYNLASATQRASSSIAINVFPNEGRHTPRGLVGDAKLALQFSAAHAVARGGEQEDCVEPELQGGAALFKDCAYLRVDVVAAPLAGIGLLALKTIPLRFTLAFWANVTLSEAHIEQVFKAGFVARELLEELANIGLFHTNNMAN